MMKKYNYTFLISISVLLIIGCSTNDDKKSDKSDKSDSTALDVTQNFAVAGTFWTEKYRIIEADESTVINYESSVDLQADWQIDLYYSDDRLGNREKHLIAENIDFDSAYPRLSRRLRLGVVGGGRISATQATAARLTDRSDSAFAMSSNEA